MFFMVMVCHYISDEKGNMLGYVLKSVWKLLFLGLVNKMVILTGMTTECEEPGSVVHPQHLLGKEGLYLFRIAGVLYQRVRVL